MTIKKWARQAAGAVYCALSIAGAMLVFAAFVFVFDAVLKSVLAKIIGAAALFVAAVVFGVYVFCKVVEEFFGD